MSKSSWLTKASGIVLLWAMAAVALPAQTFTTLFKFDATDGGQPHGGLIQATDGNFYGTTGGGGVNTNSACTAYGFSACGTVFKITPSGTLKSLYNFCSQSNCADGYIPIGPLVQGTDGNLYGTTLGGGANDNCVVGTCGGTVFTITSSGTLTTLYSFSSGAHGYNVIAGLVQATDGDFYGTTESGGAGSNHICVEDGGCGTVFKITPSGTLTTLHSFDFSDGLCPLAGLVQGTDGDFYGTTYIGGANGPPLGQGTVFKMTPSGALTTLHSFDGADGAGPLAGLVQGTDGDFYGTTFSGGTNYTCNGTTCGTVFKITPTGTLTTLHSFDETDGDGPEGTLVQGTDGDLYGTTTFGDAKGYGTVFTITPGGTLTTLYSSFGYKPGIEPTGALLQSTTGEFYGTTGYGGGINDFCGTEQKVSCGTIFSLSVGLKPFVETQPTIGSVGTPVNILGSNLTDATGVTFNGTPAVFTVVSKSLVTTTVPAGATTGTVQVITPNGKGLSNVPFTVLP